MSRDRDAWAAWLLERRHGGDEQRLRSVLDFLGPVRDRILDNAKIVPGESVLDVGCGDGLIAFSALDRVGAAGRVVFSDISEDLLDVCREIADGDPRCEFVRASADDLPLADDSVDVVTTRSVLIYLRDKSRAFQEFHRVLRPGGRLSIFEPINSYAFPQPEDRFLWYDVEPVKELSTRVKAYYRGVAGDDTLTDFDERDLIRFAEQAGFHEVRLTLEIRVGPSEPVPSCDTLERSSGNPLAPTLGEAIDGALEPDEAADFRAWLRSEEELGRGSEREAVAYLRALKKAR